MTGRVCAVLCAAGDAGEAAHILDADGAEGDLALEFQSERPWKPPESEDTASVWIERVDRRTGRTFWWNTV